MEKAYKSWSQVQTRLSFEAVVAPTTLRLSLVGVQVVVETTPSDLDQVWQQLVNVGISPTINTESDLWFPIQNLERLVGVDESVTVLCDPNIAPFWNLAKHPPKTGGAAVLTKTGNHQLNLRWESDMFVWDEKIGSNTLNALVTSNLVFVADDDVWELIEQTSSTPETIGQCSLNLDGFIEIVSTVPQLVEKAPIPGLFRLSPTHFGVSVAFANHVLGDPAFIWEGPKPELSYQKPNVKTPLPVPLSKHVETDLELITQKLELLQAAMVVWESGLGKRIVVLAALETLDAWPALIVTTPANIWLWQRHLNLFAKQGEIIPDSGDAHIVTYHDLAKGTSVGSPQAIIFDDLDTQEALVPQARVACHRFDTLLDTYRIGLAGSWPTNPNDTVEMLGLLKPAEFNPNIPIPLRYPLTTFERFGDHVGTYLSTRTTQDTEQQNVENTVGFRRSTIRRVEPSPQLIQTQNKLLSATPPTLSKLSKTIEITSRGTEQVASPKLAAVVSQTQFHTQKQRSVAVLCRHASTVELLHVLLRPQNLFSVDVLHQRTPAEPKTGVTIIRFGETLPDLTGFDVVIVVDMPWSSAVLDEAVGPPGGNHGARLVIVCHSDGTIDDRLAILAAIRRSSGETNPPTEEELPWLLSNRLP